MDCGLFIEFHWKFKLLAVYLGFYFYITTTVTNDLIGDRRIFPDF